MRSPRLPPDGGAAYHNLVSAGRIGKAREGRIGMRIAVEYQDESILLEVPEDRLVAHWSGPEPSPSLDLGAMARAQFESPIDFPALNRVVVPGDRVVVPLDPTTPGRSVMLETLASSLTTCQVESITVISTVARPDDLPKGVEWVVHDPDDKSQISYLSSTGEGRRIYLNRHLTDADIVIPVGSLGYDATLGYRGPWSAIFPGLSDRETLTRYRGLAAEGVPDPEKPSTSLGESSEVSWLLGCQFHVGVLAGVRDVLGVFAGLESGVRASGIRAVDAAWTFRAPELADLVVAGVGAPGLVSTFDDLATGLETAKRLVRRGGKIVVLSQVGGNPGPSLRRLRGAENPRSGLNRLRGREADADFPVARQIAEAAAWADIYLHGALDSDLVEDLGLIVVDRPVEAQKLASASPSSILISQADRTRAIVPDEG